MSTPITITEVDSGLSWVMPWAVISPEEPADREDELELIGNETMLVSEKNAESLRPASNLRWTFSFPPMPDESSPLNTRQLKSLLLSWKNRGVDLYLNGPDFYNLEEEILNRVTAGTYANKRFIASHPWWSSGAVVEQYHTSWSVVSPTVDTTNGWVTFDSAVTAGDLVRVTVARKPKVRLLKLNPMPQNGFGTFRYECVATFREETP